MYTPAELADAFDEADASNRRLIDRLHKEGIQRAAGKYGVDDWRVTGMAVGFGIQWAGYTFFAEGSKWLVDLARLGEVARKPSAGAAFRDGMRLLSVAGPVFRGVRVARVFLAAKAAAIGGQNSCAFTANVVAMRLSGHRLSITLGQFWQAAIRTGLLRNAEAAMHPAADSFRGVRYTRFLFAALRQYGIEVEQLVGSQTLESIRTAAAANRGPVVFRFRWQVLAPGGTDGGHFVTAFRSPFGQILVADQSGVRSFAKFVAENAGRRIWMIEGFIMPHARYLAEVPALVRAAPGLGALGHYGADGLDWLADRLELPIWHIPGPVLNHLDASLRIKLRRPPRAAAGSAAAAPSGRPPLWDDPNLEGAVAGTRRLWLVIAEYQRRGAVIYEEAVQRDAGLNDGAFGAALQELEYLYRRISRSRRIAREGDGFGGATIGVTYP
jgi:hypothetical protein